jgi:hypothetical protein
VTRARADAPQTAWGVRRARGLCCAAVTKHRQRRCFVTDMPSFAQGVHSADVAVGRSDAAVVGNAIDICSPSAKKNDDPEEARGV